ncbi:MAG TPA: patatin-like phospholipase family protein [Solirubrobacteraceae bacterium]|jgi:NTE family protein|nr:patatin-like phospholipase family protein [Solirubrobacteraceae bacterium]
MRIGLVLGGGGVVGGAWLIGALEALESETGWSPSTADVIAGTSAGSVIGALTAAGVGPSLMAAYASGGAADELAELEARGDRVLEAGLGDMPYRLQVALPPIGPGSWRMAISTLLRPLSHAPSAVMAGWLPRGFVSTRPIRDLVDRFVDAEWPEGRYWAVAADYATGRRVVFGREGAPPADVRDAVAASCAIPGFYHPVKIGGRRYIDGGVCSPSNLDLLCDEGLDLVVCLNPMSSLARVTTRSPGDRVAAAVRAQSGRRLGREARKLRERGTEVLILQPSAEDLAVMGTNFMARDRREQVVERAIRTTARDLRRRRGRPGVVFPKRTPVRRRAAQRRAA